ncbi:hypothetical protein EMIHUDRAFT_448047, partial [Emiliania huxleyi CCMP1516]|uniref:Uncharacterized protein n=2 Tax=Emiliania huxleyi TaxID=2903 RepID=A0A0D3IYI5_EMIH1
RSTAVGLSGLALPNDLSTTSPARASGSASLFLRTAREADVHLNTYTDVRRRRRCSFVSPDRQSTLGGCALPRPLRCASRRCRAAFGQLLLWRGRGEGRARVPLSSRD